MKKTFEIRVRDRAMLRMPSQAIRFLHVSGLLLSLCVGAPPAALSADNIIEASEAPELRGISMPSESTILRDKIIKDEYKGPQVPSVNTTDERVVAPGTMLELVLSSEIEAGENVAGDDFFGKLSKDVLVDGQIVIPRGTVLHGVLSTVQDPKRAGRDGYITTRFDQLITPDGRLIPIDGDSTTRDSKGKAAAKVFARAAGYTAIGGAVGTLMALQLGGLAGAAASHGATIAGGAAIGGAGGLTVAMLTKGKSVMLPPGAELHVKLNEPLQLPTMIMPDDKAEDFCVAGLKVKVVGVRAVRHAFGDMTELSLTMDIVNDTDYTFTSFDIALEDELGNVLFPSRFGDGSVFFNKILPNTSVTSNITYSVYNAKIRHKLVVFKPYSREPLARVALTAEMLASGKHMPKGTGKR